MTTSSGSPVADNLNSMTVGPNGPIVLQDFELIDKLAHFDRERIPERVVHAKGAAAHGYFEVTNDVTKFTKANFLGAVGKRTPCFLRFSTVAGERGASDTVRDPRGFAVKFYTEEGNYDMVGNNTPVFFIKDPIKFPDFIHSQKPCPVKGTNDPNMQFDYWSYTPEALHQVTILMSDRGTPYGFRHMNGYSSHTFKWVNEKGEEFLIKKHFKTDQGIKCFTPEEAAAQVAADKDFATNDLHNNIRDGNFPAWNLKVQIMPIADADKYRFDVYDVTKVWPHSDYPLIDVGRLVLNRNPENFHAETEQSAFSPSHLVPGIEASLDKMLQGRLFSYPDTHRHRLGANYEQIPINCPYRARVSNMIRDGPMSTNGNQKGEVNYDPNSRNGPVTDPSTAWHGTHHNGKIGRYAHDHPNDNYEQARSLFRNVFDDTQRKRVIDNISGGLGKCRRDIQERFVAHLFKIDAEYGSGVAKNIGLPVERSKL